MTTSASSQHYSTTETGSKPADPYKSTNLDNSNLSLKEKVDDFLNFIEGQKFGMMTTRQSETGFLVSRCMALAAKEGIDLLFHTNTESGKTDELVSDPHVNVAFLKSSNGDWASVSGIASIINDREYVKKYYSAQLKAWVGDLGDGVHDGSASDPRVGIIKIHIKSATYAIQKGTAVGRAFEVAKGTVTGQPANVNKLRELTQDDLDTFRKSIDMVS